MGIIRGVVVVHETNVGISELLVVAHNAAPAAPVAGPRAPAGRELTGARSPAELVATHAASAATPRRIGSVLTDAGGRFELEYDDALQELRLEVLAASSGGDGEHPVLFREARPAPGRIESFVVRIPADTLKELGGAEPAVTSVGKMFALAAARDHVGDAVAAFTTQRLETIRAAQRTRRADVEASLGARPEPATRGETYVHAKNEHSASSSDKLSSIVEPFITSLNERVI